MRIGPLGSHQFIDYFALACHRAVAERLRREPENIIKIARENLTRWMASGIFDKGEMRSPSEWEKILSELNIEELIAIITEDSAEGQRLRQSTPFAGALSEDERLKILADCELMAEKLEGDLSRETLTGDF